MTPNKYVIKGSSQNLTYKRNLRQRMTAPEIILWQKLRANQLGFKYRRQHGIGNFILDFYCATLKLGIEIDGDTHATMKQMNFDNIRTEFLSSVGITVIRFYNQEIMTNLSGVLEKIIKVQSSLL